MAEGSAAMSGHAGLHALGRFCDVLGLGELLCGAYGPIGEREPVGDRGKALVQALLVFAGGGEACSDIEVLRCEGAVFGSVPSAPTLYRVARGVDAERPGALGAAAARHPAAGVAPVRGDSGGGRDRHRRVAGGGSL